MENIEENEKASSSDDDQLVRIISRSKEILSLLNQLEKLNVPNAYLAGGAVTQCVWNYLSNKPLMANIKDFDVVYYDPTNEHEETELEHQLKLACHLNLPIDLKNQAFVHTWYKHKFGNNIEPLASSEAGIRMWLSAFAVGVRLIRGQIEVYSPYGLQDLFEFTIKPNKVAMSENNYNQMCTSFKSRWPKVSVTSW